MSKLKGLVLLQVSWSARGHQTGSQSSTGECQECILKGLCDLDGPPIRLE